MLDLLLSFKQVENQSPREVMAHIRVNDPEKEILLIEELTPVLDQE